MLVLLVEVVVFDKKLKSPTPVDDDVFNDDDDDDNDCDCGILEGAINAGAIGGVYAAEFSVLPPPPMTKDNASKIPALLWLWLLLLVLIFVIEEEDGDDIGDNDGAGTEGTGGGLLSSAEFIIGGGLEGAGGT